MRTDVSPDDAIDSETIAVEDTGLVVEDTAIVVEDTAIVVEDTGLVVEDTGLVVEDTAIVVEDTTVIDEDTTVIDEDTTVIDEDTTVIGEDTTVIGEDTTVIGEDIDEDTTVIGEDIDEDTTVIVEDTTVNEDTSVADTSIVEDSAIPGEDTILDEDTSVVADSAIADDDTCAPACGDRACGDDGCGGRCGDCLGGATCTDAGDCRWLARGRIRYEQRRPNAGLTALGPIEVVPLVDHDVVVRAGAAVLGTVTTDAEGAFVLPLEVPPGASLSALVVAAARPEAPGLVPPLTLLDGLTTTFPGAPSQPLDSSRVWSWTAFAPASDPTALDLGDITITAAQGSGALTLLFDLAAARNRAVAAFVDAGLVDDPSTLPNIGVLWHPSRTPPCLSCYFPEPWGPVRLVDGQGAVVTTFDRGLFLSGAAAAPQHWTPSLSGHELGHWVMDVLSRLPDAGGAHAWNAKVWPPLAWSEGFATFFAQWSLSAGGPASRFFTMQQNIQYWVDLERIGTAPVNDDTSLPFTFPLPSAAGPLTQDMNEGVIAAILWDLYDPVDAAAGDARAHGDLALTDIALVRLATADQDRGVAGPDLVDYIDALVCAGLTWAELQPVFMGFPWAAPALCPPGP